MFGTSIFTSQHFGGIFSSEKRMRNNMRAQAKNYKLRQVQRSKGNIDESISFFIVTLGHINITCIVYILTTSTLKQSSLQLQKYPYQSSLWKVVTMWYSYKSFAEFEEITSFLRQVIEKKNR